MWLGDMPMPEGATSEMMWAAYEEIQKIESRDYAVEQLAWYEGMWRKLLKRYKELEANDDDESREKLVHVKESIKLVKEGIEMFREELANYGW